MPTTNITKTKENKKQKISVVFRYTSSR